MKRIGVIGLGDMGGGIAANCIKAGFRTCGFDLEAERLAKFEALGGQPLQSARQVGEHADTVFVMVLNGGQVKQVIVGEDGLVGGMPRGSTIILSATIKPSEAVDIETALADTGIALIDCPVSGGQSGARNGTLTMIAAAPKKLLEENRDVMEAVGQNIFHVDERIGMGQTLKACLQGWMGAIFGATFEAAVLAARSGLDMAVFADVAASSAGRNPLTEQALQCIMDRRFVDTGSGIGTMYKDLTVTLDHARDMGVPMFMAASAMQMFQAGITRFPDEDNWAVAKILEEIVGVEIRRPE